MRYVLRKYLAGFVLAMLVAVPDSARAVSIEFAVVSLGGDMYRYEYIVTSNGSLGPGVAIEMFEILFDPLLYDERSLTIVTPDPPATDWDESILSSLPGVPAAYNALELSGGIPPGVTVPGFAVAFTWLGGPQGPGAQPWQILDSDSFDLLAEGATSPIGVTPIPEPGTLVLLGTGLLSVASWRRKGHSRCGERRISRRVECQGA